MKKRRFSVEQIVAVLKQSELGVPVAEVIRKVGISEQTFYRWNATLTRDPFGNVRCSQSRRSVSSVTLRHSIRIHDTGL